MFNRIPKKFHIKRNRKRFLLVTTLGVLIFGALIIFGVQKYRADENITLPSVFAITWGSPTASMTHQASLVAFYSTKMSNWKTGETIKINDMRYYGGHTYQALRAHTTSSTTEPGVGADWADNWSQSTVGIYQNYDGSPRMMYPLQDTIDKLKAKPEGKRVVLIQGVDGGWNKHPDDRCRDSSDTLNAFSKSPKGNGQVGNDGLPSGYYCPWSDQWKIDADLFTQALVNKIVESGASVDYVLFDMESTMSVWEMNSAWETAIMQDPRWPALKSQLDEMVRLRRGYPEGSTDPKAQFPVDLTNMTFGDWAGDTLNTVWNDWGALQEKHVIDSLNVIFDDFKNQWPNVKGSEYGFAGWKVNDGNLELNGHRPYSLGVVGTHASTINYGWLFQARSQTAGDDRWHTLLWEQNQNRGSVRAGYGFMPWISFSGFTEGSRWKTDPDSLYPRTPDPYWQENIRHMVLLGADPILNFAPNSSPRIEKIDLETKTLEVYSGQNNICSWLGDFEIDNSPENNGHYVLTSCTNGDTTNFRTRIVTSTPLVSNLVGGVVRMAGTATSSNAIDQQTEDLLVELDGQIGTDGPRQTVQSEMLDYLSNTLVTGLRHGSQVTYRVSYNRSDWSNPQTMNILKNGTQIDTLIIPAGRIGTYYTTDYNAADKYSFTPANADPILTNLLPNNDFNSASWLCDGVACTTAKIGPNSLDVSDPSGGNKAWKINLAYKRLTPSTAITVKPNTTYIISADTKCYNSVAPPPYSISCGGYIGIVDSNGESKGTWANILATKGWNKSSFAYTTGPNETAITPYLGLNQAYIYNLKLSEEPPPAPYIRDNGGVGTVSIPEPKLSRTFTYKNKMTITGTKHAKVKKVLINNKEAQVDNNANTWSLEVDLAYGQNTLTILGQDDTNKSSSTVTKTITRRKIGDFNNDTKIDGSDFTLLLFNWGSVVANNFADFNEDGKVDGSDFTIMLYWWGK